LEGKWPLVVSRLELLITALPSPQIDPKVEVGFFCCVVDRLCTLIVPSTGRTRFRPVYVGPPYESEIDSAQFLLFLTMKNNSPVYILPRIKCLVPILHFNIEKLRWGHLSIANFQQIFSTIYFDGFK
jgi:hypothetical protein